MLVAVSLKFLGTSPSLPFSRKGSFIVAWMSQLPKGFDPPQTGVQVGKCKVIYF